MELPIYVVSASGVAGSILRRPAKILVVDDHQILRDGVRVVLGGDSRWQICGEAKDGQEAIDKVLELHPDIVILDVTMPVKSGLVAAGEIRRLKPSAKILMFSVHESPTIHKEVERAGADAFVMKSAPAGDLIAAVARLLRPVPGSSVV